MRAMPTGGTIQVCARNAGGQIEIVVRDEGSGIAAAMLEHLFLPHVTTGSSGGSSGLGLHIVETIVKHDGGYVRAANRTDALGAEFTITLPSRPQAIPARAS
jgi:signal transduction histidine kinase